MASETGMLPKMEQHMEIESLAKHNSILVAPYEGTNFNLGKPKEMRDGGTIKMHYVPASGRKIPTFATKLFVGSSNMEQGRNNFE